MREGKKIYKSETDKKVMGVCGGLAEYLEVDSTIIRLIWVMMTFFAGTGILLYLIAAIVIPNRPAGDKETKKEERW